MKYELIIKPAAELDIDDSLEWYERKLEGLGERFLDDLDKKLLRVQTNPLHYQIRYKSVRIAFLDVFPDAVHYTVEENTIYVHAILGTSRDPNLWVK